MSRSPRSHCVRPARPQPLKHWRLNMPDNSFAPPNLSVVPVNANSCKPFLLEVMVFSPEAGFKFQVSIERSCESATKAIWKLVFDLYKIKKNSSEFDQIVHVSYRAENEIQQRQIAATATQGVSPEQAKRLITKVHPAVKDLENAQNLSADELNKRKAKVRKEISKAVDVVKVEF